MTKQEEMIKVYTKYDMPVPTVIQSFIRKLTRRELKPLGYLPNMTQTGFISSRELKVKSIEQGLEGVRFFHYGD